MAAFCLVVDRRGVSCKECGILPEYLQSVFIAQMFSMSSFRDADMKMKVMGNDDECI